MGLEIEACVIPKFLDGEIVDFCFLPQVMRCALAQLAILERTGRHQDRLSEAGYGLCAWRGVFFAQLAVRNIRQPSLYLHFCCFSSDHKLTCIIAMCFLADLADFRPRRPRRDFFSLDLLNALRPFQCFAVVFVS